MQNYTTINNFKKNGWETEKEDNDKPKKLKRGQMYWCEITLPHDLSQQTKRRPVIVVGHDTLNTYSPTTLVVPVTSQVKRLELDTHAVFNSPNGRESMVLAECMMTIKKSQLDQFIGALNDKDFSQVMRAVLFAVGAY